MVDILRDFRFQNPRNCGSMGHAGFGVSQQGHIKDGHTVLYRDHLVTAIEVLIKDPCLWVYHKS